MNHKLHNTILASAVVGATLLFGLLAARPVPDDIRQDHRARFVWTGGLPVELARDIERGVFVVEVDQAGSGEVLALVSAILASSAMESTLATVLDDVALHPRQAPRPRADSRTADALASAPARRRAALATPYFSTARGMGRGHGE